MLAAVNATRGEMEVIVGHGSSGRVWFIHCGAVGRGSFTTEDTEDTERAQSGNIASHATGAYLVPPFRDWFRDWFRDEFGPRSLARSLISQSMMSSIARILKGQHGLKIAFFCASVPPLCSLCPLW